MAGKTKRVVVTGGNGLVGAGLIPRLLDAGYEVKSIGKEPWPESPCLHVVADLNEYGEAVDAIAGYDQVIHLAAHSLYTEVSDQRTFAENVGMTFNVFQAAKTLGVSRVVWASSMHGTGHPFSAEYPVARIPMKETDEYSNSDAYGLSKKVCEDMTKAPRYWEGIELVCIRVSWVMEETGPHPFTYVDREKTPRTGFLARWPYDLKSLWADPTIRLRNLWGYVDARDLFQAFKLALESERDLSGEIFNITAADTIMNVPTRDLIAKYMPTAEVDAELPEFGSCYSIGRASDLLGYEPKYLCRDMADH